MNTMHTKRFCTITTLDYMPYVYALYDSLKRYNAEIPLDVLITDAGSAPLDQPGRFPHMRCYRVEEVCKSGLGEKLYRAYHAVSMDKFRWSMKPVFLKYLLEHEGCEKIIFVDNDICFFHEYSFLFDELDQSDILLTPHWRIIDPHLDPSNFFSLYTSGLYNAGFVGVNKNAVAALRWWAKACLFVCEKNESKGQFDDQTHLNLLPIYFDNVKIIKHRGCNVANWNRVECARIQKGDTVFINGIDPVVFIHFTSSTIRGIEKGDDALLAPFLKVYRENLQQYGVCLQGNRGGESQPVVAAARDKSFVQRACGTSRIFQRIRTFFNG